MAENWPTKGDISIDEAKLRYNKDSELVLKGLSIDVKAGEKVGVVGRTGAGKSTIANSLTRITEICDGTIKYDDVEILKTNLVQVRKAVTIIP